MFLSSMAIVLLVTQVSPEKWLLKQSLKLSARDQTKKEEELEDLEFKDFVRNTIDQWIKEDLMTEIPDTTEPKPHTKAVDDVDTIYKRIQELKQEREKALNTSDTPTSIVGNDSITSLGNCYFCQQNKTSCDGSCFYA